MALALHPDQPEVAAGRTKRHVTFVDQREPQAQRAQTKRDRGPDQAAADHRDFDVSRGHVLDFTPAKRRSAGICGTKSTNV